MQFILVIIVSTFMYLGVLGLGLASGIPPFSLGLGLVASSFVLIKLPFLGR